MSLTGVLWLYCYPLIIDSRKLVQKCVDSNTSTLKNGPLESVLIKKIYVPLFNKAVHIAKQMVLCPQRADSLDVSNSYWQICHAGMKNSSVIAAPSLCIWAASWGGHSSEGCI